MKRFEACDNMVIIFIDEDNEGAAGSRTIRQTPQKHRDRGPTSERDYCTELKAREKFSPPPVSLGSNLLGSN